MTKAQLLWCKNYELKTGFDPMMDDFKAGIKSFYDAARFAIDWYEHQSADALHSIGQNIPGDPINES